MDAVETNWRDVALAVVAGVVAFVVYLVTLAVGAYPGDFSAILTQSAGLFPRLTPGFPLWFGLAHLLRSLPVADIAAPFNMASAVFGGIAVGLMCHVINQAVLALVRIDEDNEWHTRMAGRLAGAGAALALAFCMPFWVASTRSHLAPFHVAYFLLATHVFLLAVNQHRRWAAILFGFLYGVGVVEDPTFVLFGLPFAVAYLVALSRREALEPRQWWPPLAACLLGLGLYALAAWQFLGSAGATLTDQHAFFGVLWSLWRGQWHFIAHSLPSQGWLVVVLVTILPAAIALLVSRRALNNEQDWTYYILHVVLTALAVVVALNLSKIPTPWQLLGYQRLLIMPYVLQAALFGYLLAYWYLLPTPWRIASGQRRLVRRAVGPVLAVVGLSLLVVSACRNFSKADGRPSALLRDFSAEVVRSLAGRTWLVTDGTLDASLLVEARRQGVELRLLNTAAEQNPIMQKYVAGQFQDARMRNLALLGTRALLNEWLEKKPEALNQVAFLTAAEILVGAGFQSVPHGALYLGRRASEEIDAGACMQESRELWKRIAESKYLRGLAPAGPLEAYRRHLLHHLSVVANNLGVFMEDQGREAEGYEAYAQARVFDPSNVSALMNQYTMLEHGFQAPDAEAVRKALAVFRESVRGKPPPVGAVIRGYGEIRSPSAFSTLGGEWARMGQPELAASGLRRAMGLVPEEGRGAYKQALAGLYLMQNRADESEALFTELLVANPKNQTALLGMARIELQREQPAKARAYLDRAQGAGVPDALMQLEWAAFYTSTDDLKQAKDTLHAVLETQPDLVRALAMLTAINIQERDTLGLVDTLRRIGRVRQGAEFLQAIAGAYLAMMQDDQDGAAMAFEKALSMQPGDPQILEWLTRLDVLLGRTDRMEAHLRQLLRVAPANAFGNFILAGLQKERGQIDLARDSLARSLETERTPEALNDMAWLLQESGLYQEAEAQARAALELRADMPQVWDTLGMVLMKTDRLEEARMAFEKALAFEKDSVPVTLHVAELDLRQGRRDDATRRFTELEARRHEMTIADREALDALRRK